jgi:predicted dehydrogenase
MNKTTMNIGISGAGRTAGLASYLAEHDGIVIRGGYDPDQARMKSRLKDFNNPVAIVYRSFQEMLDDPMIDWVMIGSPNNRHCEQIIAAFRAGKHVFSEKPLATTIEECLAIVKAHAESGLQLAMGFCLRYALLYRRAKEILKSGRLGKVISIAANENINPGHGAYIMSQWRRHKEIAGPHILEKCSHDLDILNWLTGSIPRRVAAFGGTDFFVPENRHLLDNPKQRENMDSFNSFYRLHKYWDQGTDPFTSEKNIEDNIVTIIEYFNGARAQFQATMCNTMPERRMYLNCTEGNMVLDQYAAYLRYQSLSDSEPQNVPLAEFHDAHLEGYQKVHSDADRSIMHELADTIRTGLPAQCSSQEGMIGSVTAIMIDKARAAGQILDLTETWKSLGIQPQQ